MRTTVLSALLLLTACDSNDDTNRPAPTPPCTSTADCSNGTCLNSRCVADGSVAGGGTCELDQQCRSGTCLTDNTCEYTPGEPGGPCAAGDTCDTGASCLTAVCVADGSLAAGASCTLSAQCASDACLSMVCAAGLGESCSTLPCAPDTMTCFSLTNICIANGSLGTDEYCTDDLQCASGDCSGTCAPPACEPTGPAGGLSFTGSMDATVPNDAVLAIIWIVTSGNDYEWVYGTATASGTSLSVNLADMPPPQAVNSYGLAIGVVAAFPAGTVIPTGEFVDPDTLLGATDRHAIIWKATCGIDEFWAADFDPGYACGVCVPAARGETFDSYAPTDCANVTVHPDDQSFDFCNWT